MFCHGELARLKPDPRHLTLYYLMLSLGGALGALAVAIGAPLVLAGYYEMQIALVLVAILSLLRVLKEAAFVPALAAVAIAAVSWYSWGSIQTYRQNVRVMVRDFYGTVRTRDNTEVFPLRAMYHGPINHGGQLLDPKLSMSPSTYFGPTSGYGRSEEHTSELQSH